jgi:hypothetical protein
MWNGWMTWLTARAPKRPTGTIYEAWGPPEGPADAVVPAGSSLTMLDGEVVLFCIRAETWEECMAAYHEIRGFEPYVPMPNGIPRKE